MTKNLHEEGAGMGGADNGQQIAPLPRVSIQAFCVSADLAASINAAVQDRRMSKTHVKVHMGGSAAAVAAYRSAPTPNVIVIETVGERQTILEHLDTLAEFCDAGTKVVVIGHLNDIHLYRALIARGVSNYLVEPLSVLDFIAALSELYAGEAAAPVGRVVAVTGAKGGVGASMIAHNLAWSISQNQEISTVVVDLDLGFGTAGLDFNLDPPQGIADAIFATDRLDSNLLDRLLSKCSERLSILAAPASLERQYDLEQGDLDNVIDTLRQSVPMIVLDIPHCWTGWSRHLLTGADEVIIVAAPDLANFRNTKNIIDILQQSRSNDHPPRLVINGLGVPKRPEITITDFAKQVGLTPVATLAFDPKLFGTAANNGQMIAEIEPTNKSNEAIADLACLITGRVAAPKPKKSLFQPLAEKFIRKKAS